PLPVAAGFAADDAVVLPPAGVLLAVGDEPPDLCVSRTTPATMMTATTTPIAMRPRMPRPRRGSSSSSRRGPRDAGRGPVSVRERPGFSQPSVGGRYLESWSPDRPGPCPG